MAAAALGVALLLWHELGRMAGRPWGAAGMLVSAAVWALGTQQLRRTRMTAPTLAIVFWMTVITTLVMTRAGRAVRARPLARRRGPTVWAAIVFNAVMIFGFAQPVWLYLARSLPPVASTLSVMMIPVLGTLSGAWWLDEQLHWQDFAAIVLMLAAIASVLWPARPRARSAGLISRRRDRGSRAPARICVSRASITCASRARLVVVALRVQRAVHQQVGVVRLERHALLARLALDHRRAQHQVGHAPPARARSRRSARWWRSPCRGSRGSAPGLRRHRRCAP